MSDDLSKNKLTPTDPANVDPNWSEKRRDILDDVLAAASQRRRATGVV